MNNTYTFLKIGEIAGGFYSSGNTTNTIIVYGPGAPNLPDSGNLADASIVLSHNIDIFVPDYIGFGRSDGIFTPMNCIKTFLDLYDGFKSGCIGKNSYFSISQKLKYSRIIFIGRSFGGAYIPLLPRFNPEIKELAVFYPVVDSKSCGSIPGEETNEEFLGSMDRDGYKYLYRGIMDDAWKDHLENRDDLSPMDNIRYLKKSRLFIAHGMKDTCINYSKSQKYFDKIREELASSDVDRKIIRENFKLKLYPQGEHNRTTSRKAIRYYLKWLGL